MRPISGAGAILAATDHNPYVRFTLSLQRDPAGFVREGAVAWFGQTPLGRLGHVLGEPAAVDDLFRHATASGLTTTSSWVNLSRRPTAEIPDGFVVREHWDFRWSMSVPPDVPGEGDVVTVADDEPVRRLLAVAAPHGDLRPGNPLVRSWWGVWDGTELVACAGDRSHGEVGMIGGVAVHPEYRRRGLAAAVCTVATRVLRASHPLVSLGVVATNDAAARIYHRMGYTGVVSLTSIKPR
jgi:ribosomal protein S18 acetylase RimI-like enzyme